MQNIVSSIFLLFLLGASASQPQAEQVKIKVLVTGKTITWLGTNYADLLQKSEKCCGIEIYTDERFAGDYQLNIQTGILLDDFELTRQGKLIKSMRNRYFIYWAIKDICLTIRGDAEERRKQKQGSSPAQ